jgi:hypothetical protein
MSKNYEAAFWISLYGGICFLFLPSRLVRLIAVILFGMLVYGSLQVVLEYEALQASCGGLK